MLLTVTRLSLSNAGLPSQSVGVCQWGYPGPAAAGLGGLCDFVTVEFVVTESSTGPRKRFREMTVAHGGGHDRGLPWLAPIRNSCELRVLCCRSCFGPRTCGRGITSSSKRFGALNQGFPFSPLQCRHGRTRMGGWVVQRKCVRCMQWLCCGLWCWGTSLMIQPQVRPFQLSLFRTVGGKPMCDVIMGEDVSFSFWC